MTIAFLQKKANFALHSAVMEHYFSGGYYPMGGGSAIVKAITKAINKHGGEIKTGQTVKNYPRNLKKLDILVPL